MKLKLHHMILLGALVQPAYSSTVALTASFANFVTGTDFDDANTLSGGDWYDASTGLVFTDVFNDAVSGFDVDVVITATSAYTIVDAAGEALNGTTNGNDVFLHQARSNDVDFTVCFVDASNGAAVDSTFFGGSFCYSLVFTDLDGITSTGLDTITSYDHSAYSVTTTAQLDITTSGTTATVSANNTANNYPNPSSPTLSAVQQDASVIFDFVDEAKPTFNYSIIGGRQTIGRAAFIDGGEYTFTQPAVTVAAPEPSSTALLGFGILGLLARRKK